ncbi:uncharacterized protein LOC143511023 isoform X8 [Brachyhypopomus gauderio]|uniref:uncharacterized protein LOC143511023 isoform X8 n=1 Tax=Brachyhypopomus gauderio TaxID=698409 RepID=UPI004041E407
MDVGHLMGYPLLLCLLALAFASCTANAQSPGNSINTVNSKASGNSTNTVNSKASGNSTNIVNSTNTVNSTSTGNFSNSSNNSNTTNTGNSKSSGNSTNTVNSTSTGNFSNSSNNSNSKPSGNSTNTVNSTSTGNFSNSSNNSNTTNTGNSKSSGNSTNTVNSKNTVNSTSTGNFSNSSNNSNSKPSGNSTNTVNSTSTGNFSNSSNNSNTTNTGNSKSSGNSTNTVNSKNTVNSTSTGNFSNSSNNSNSKPSGNSTNTVNSTSTGNFSNSSNNSNTTNTGNSKSSGNSTNTVNSKNTVNSTSTGNFSNSSNNSNSKPSGNSTNTVNSTSTGNFSNSSNNSNTTNTGNSKSSGNSTNTVNSKNTVNSTSTGNFSNSSNNSNSKPSGNSTNTVNSTSTGIFSNSSNNSNTTNTGNSKPSGNSTNTVNSTSTGNFSNSSSNSNTTNTGNSKPSGNSKNTVNSTSTGNFSNSSNNSNSKPSGNSTNTVNSTSTGNFSNSSNNSNTTHTGNSKSSGNSTNTVNSKNTVNSTSTGNFSNSSNNSNSKPSGNSTNTVNSKSTGNFSNSSNNMIFFPIGPEAHASSFPYDGASVVIDLDYPFMYHGRNYSQFYLDMNGFVSFFEPSPELYPNSSIGQDMIAPFWADIENDEGGEVYYEQATDGPLIEVATDAVNQAFQDADFEEAAWVFVATWLNMPLENNEEAVSFQVVLISDEYGRSYVLMNYQNFTDLQESWLAGFAVDDNDDFDRLRVNDSSDLSFESNVGFPGRWAFQVSFQDICDVLQCSEDEVCVERTGIYGCVCAANNTRPNPDTFDAIETCKSSFGMVSFSRCQLFEAGYSARFLHLNDKMCKGVVHRGRVVFYFDYDGHSCGTVLKHNDTHFTYENKIEAVMGVGDDSVISRDSWLTIDISCTYPLIESNSNSMILKAKGSVIRKDLNIEGSYEIVMIPYPDPSFSTPYPHNVTLHLNDLVYVAVDVVGVDSKQIAIVLDRCWATPVNDMDYIVYWNLIINECPNPEDGTVQVLQNGVSTSGHFSFRMFTFKNISPYVFLHCQVHLCLVESGECAQTCSGDSDRRRRRSVDFHDTVKISMNI